MQRAGRAGSRPWRWWIFTFVLGLFCFSPAVAEQRQVDQPGARPSPQRATLLDGLLRPLKKSAAVRLPQLLRQSKHVVVDSLTKPAGAVLSRLKGEPTRARPAKDPFLNLENHRSNHGDVQTASYDVKDAQGRPKGTHPDSQSDMRSDKTTLNDRHAPSAVSDSTGPSGCQPLPFAVDIDQQLDRLRKSMEKKADGPQSNRHAPPLPLDFDKSPRPQSDTNTRATATDQPLNARCSSPPDRHEPMTPVADKRAFSQQANGSSLRRSEPKQTVELPQPRSICRASCQSSEQPALLRPRTNQALPTQLQTVRERRSCDTSTSGQGGVSSDGPERMPAWVDQSMIVDSATLARQKSSAPPTEQPNGGKLTELLRHALQSRQQPNSLADSRSAEPLEITTHTGRSLGKAAPVDTPLQPVTPKLPRAEAAHRNAENQPKGASSGIAACTQMAQRTDARSQRASARRRPTANARFDSSAYLGNKADSIQDVSYARLLANQGSSFATGHDAPKFSPPSASTLGEEQTNLKNLENCRPAGQASAAERQKRLSLSTTPSSAHCSVSANQSASLERIEPTWPQPPHEIGSLPYDHTPRKQPDLPGSMSQTAAQPQTKSEAYATMSVTAKAGQVGDPACFVVEQTEGLPFELERSPTKHASGSVSHFNASTEVVHRFSRSAASLKKLPASWNKEVGQSAFDVMVADRRDRNRTREGELGLLGGPSVPQSSPAPPGRVGGSLRKQASLARPTGTVMDASAATDARLAAAEPGQWTLRKQQNVKLPPIQWDVQPQVAGNSQPSWRNTLSVVLASLILATVYWTIVFKRHRNRLRRSTAQQAAEIGDLDVAKGKAA